ncbi:ABC transporter ATP-binding protein [Homoserinimonas sp. A447]
MIQLDGVTKHYPNQERAAVNELSLSINAGEFVVFVGPSGCGKTTTLRMINRLVEPTTGKIWIDGEDVTHVDADILRRRMGYVIQHVGLLPHLTVADNVGIVPKMNGVPQDQRRQRSDELLSLVGLDPAQFGARYPRQLSGGQQQRVGVARALAADPPIMLMDEPFAAVDPIARKMLQDEFRRLQKLLEKTIVFVTHDIDEALRLGDRIAIFDNSSRVAQFATPLEILTNPADEFVTEFVGAGAAVRRLSLLTVGDIIRKDAVRATEPVMNPITVAEDMTVQGALEQALTRRAAGISIASVEQGTIEISLQELLLAAADTAEVPV